MSSIITRLRPEVFFATRKEDLDEIDYLMFLWNTGLIDSNYMYREIMDYVDVNRQYTKLKLTAEFRNWLSTYRWAVFYNNDCTRLKCAVIEMLLEQTSTRAQAEKTVLRRSLSPDSANHYIEMIEDEYRWPVLKNVLKRKLKDDGVIEDFTIYPSDIRRQFDEDNRRYNIEKICGIKARQHLKFIADGNRFDLKDLARDILERCIGYYNRERPLKNRLYASNYTKSCIDGRWKQMINYWTAPERARLVDGRTYGEDGVYTNRVKSISEIEGAMFDETRSVWDMAV